MLISAYSTRLEFVPHDFTPVDEHFRWHESGEQDAGFATSLSELEDYVTRAGVGQPTETVRMLLRHVRDTQRSYRFTLDGAATGPETIDDSIAQGQAAAIAALNLAQGPLREAAE